MRGSLRSDRLTQEKTRGSFRWLVFEFEVSPDTVCAAVEYQQTRTALVVHGHWSHERLMRPVAVSEYNPKF